VFQLDVGSEVENVVHIIAYLQINTIICAAQERTDY